MKRHPCAFWKKYGTGRGERKNWNKELYCQNINSAVEVWPYLYFTIPVSSVNNYNENNPPIKRWYWINYKPAGLYASLNLPVSPPPLKCFRYILSVLSLNNKYSSLMWLIYIRFCSYLPENATSVKTITTCDVYGNDLTYCSEAYCEFGR